MTSFLFWNINKKDLQRSIGNLTRKYEIDVLMLAECEIETGVLLRELNEGHEFDYHYSPGIACEKIEVFTQFPRKFIRPVDETDRVTIRHFELPGPN